MPVSGSCCDVIGPAYQRRVNGLWRFGMRMEEARHSNVRGVVHGGVLTSFLDQFLGKLVWDALEDKLAATINLSTDFLAGAELGDWIEGEGEVTRQTGSLVFMHGRVLKGETTLATASGIWKVIGQR
jgi:acyl-coenzyme A thioesterase PaaI-like protein